MNSSPENLQTYQNQTTFQDVETARQNYHNKHKRIWRRSFAIVFGIILALALFSLLTSKGTESVTLRLVSAAIFTIFTTLIVGIVVPSIAVAIATNKENANYRRAYKAYFVEHSLMRTFTHLKYSHTIGIDSNLLTSSGYLRAGDRYNANDLIIAKYKDVSFIQSDVHIQDEYTDSDGDTHYVTVFKGRFMIFEFPKQFNFRLELIGKHFRVAKIPKTTTSGRKMSKLSTESTNFNHSFKIYAEDGFEAYYLLDPAMIDKLQSLADIYKNNLFLGFLNNTLIVGLSDGKDSFEPPSYKQPLNEQAELNKVSADIKTITDLVDLLRLDRNKT